MSKERWSKEIEEELVLLIKDWLRQTGRTQSELCQSLHLPSARMPSLIESLKKDFCSGGIPKIANKLCEIEKLWTYGGAEKTKKNFDLIPDFIPASGFSDDLVALTAVISLWQHHITPEIKFRAKSKLDKWFPL